MSLTVKPLFSPTLPAGAEQEAISHRPFWAVVVTPCNVCKPTVARGDKGPPLCNEGRGLFARWIWPLGNC